MYTVFLSSRYLEGKHHYIEKDVEYSVYDSKSDTVKRMIGKDILHKLTLKTQKGLFENVFWSDVEPPYYIDKPRCAAIQAAVKPFITLDVFNGCFTPSFCLPFSFGIIPIGGGVRHGVYSVGGVLHSGKAAVAGLYLSGFIL